MQADRAAGGAMVQDGAVVSVTGQGNQNAHRYRVHSTATTPAAVDIARGVRRVEGCGIEVAVI